MIPSPANTAVGDDALTERIAARAAHHATAEGTKESEAREAADAARLGIELVRLSRSTRLAPLRKQLALVAHNHAALLARIGVTPATITPTATTAKQAPPRTAPRARGAGRPAGRKVASSPSSDPGGGDDGPHHQRAPQAARDAVAEAFRAILAARHPERSWSVVA